MIRKVFLQGITLVVLFFSTWFVLSKVNWMTIFKVQQATGKTEEKLGELFWDVYKKTGNENKNPLITKTLDSIVTKICLKNKIDRTTIKIHVLNKDEVNAFALPNGHLVVYSGLILAADNPEELSGVIGHEMAHIELNHVMKKLVKEVGISLVISMASGNGGTEIIKQTSKMLSSSAFDRKLEKEADIKAVDYMLNANINSEPFANFLYKLSEKETETTKYLSWISTHPDSKERAEYIIEYRKGKKGVYKSVITQSTWNTLKEKLKD